MGPIVMVVGDVIRNEPLEMVLVQRNDLVEQFAPAAADPAFRDSILQGLWIEVCTQPIVMDRIAARTSSPYFAS